jgi:glucosamine-6-phosphate deaminase
MQYGKTFIQVCKNYEDLGIRAASAVGAKMRELLSRQDEIRMVLSAGESQSSFLRYLALEKGIEWQRVICFNIDDFWDIRMPETFTCGFQTQKELYEKVLPKAFHLVDYKANDPEKECRRFETLLKEKPLNIACLGIGQSGHIALNEPEETDFHDAQGVRFVTVSEKSKRQLMEDTHFRDLGYIPGKGITMTIPAILSAGHIYTMVPLRLKQEILTQIFAQAEPVESLPATILSTTESLLFVDEDSLPQNLGTVQR